MKTFVVGGDTGYARFLENVELVDKLEDAELVIFTGGSDVTPSYYGCKEHRRTYCNPERDAEEKKAFDSIKPEQLVLGICRGSQFLCVMNKGLLVQDCDNHAIGRTHEITDGDMCYQITSTHHQMQYPYNLPKDDYTVLYRSSNLLSNRWEGDKIDAEEIIRNGEPEIVLYHKKGYPKCIAVQGHPEMIPESPVAKMINELVKTTYANR